MWVKTYITRYAQIPPLLWAKKHKVIATFAWINILLELWIIRIIVVGHGPCPVQCRCLTVSLPLWRRWLCRHVCQQKFGQVDGGMSNTVKRSSSICPVSQFLNYDLTCLIIINIPLGRAAQKWLMPMGVLDLVSAHAWQFLFKSS